MGVSVVPDFRAVFVLVVGNLLFLPRSGNSLRIRRAKVCALLFPLPRFQDKGRFADVRQLYFLITQDTALKRLIAVRIQLVGVVQLDLRFAVFRSGHLAVAHGDVVPGFQTGYTGFEVC